MSDGLAEAMSRINQIRSAFGDRGGVLGISGNKGNDGGFEKMLRAAGTSTKKSGGSVAGRTTKSAGNDPLDRIKVARSTRKPGGSLGSESTRWPDGVPKEAEDYADEFIAASEETGVPLRILLAVARAESGFDPDAESPAGALGMMQLMPGTAAGLGVDPTDPAQNILGGARYLAAQYQAFGSWDLAFAAYNAGPGAVSQYGGIPPYQETQSYVAIINGFLDQMSAPSASAAGLVAQRAALPDGVIDLDALGTDLGTPLGAADPGAPTDPAAATDPDPTAPAALAAMPTGTAALQAAVPGAATAQGGGGDLPGRTGAGPTGAGADAAAVGSTSSTARPASSDPLPTVLTTTPMAFGEQLLAQVHRTRADGGHGHRLNVRLDPPELGRLDVSFEMRGEQVFVVVRPEKAEGGALLAQQRDRIAQLFAREGLELSSFDVGANGGQTPGRNMQNQSGSRPYGIADLDLTTEVAFTVDRELRL